MNFFGIFLPTFTYGSMILQLAMNVLVIVACIKVIKYINYRMKGKK